MARVAAENAVGVKVIKSKADVIDSCRLGDRHVRTCGSDRNTTPDKSCAARALKCKLPPAHVRQGEIYEMSRESVQPTTLIFARESFRL